MHVFSSSNHTWNLQSPFFCKARPFVFLSTIVRPSIGYQPTAPLSIWTFHFVPLAKLLCLVLIAAQFFLNIFATITSRINPCSNHDFNICRLGLWIIYRWQLYFKARPSYTSLLAGYFNLQPNLAWVLLLYLARQPSDLSEDVLI